MVDTFLLKGDVHFGPPIRHLQVAALLFERCCFYLFH